MSLNDPRWGNQGGNGNKGGNQGPPDLEDLWRDFNRRLSALFGGKSSGDGGGDSRPPVGARQFGGGIGVILGLVLIVWLASGLYIVDASQRGVVLRFGKYHETVGPGLNIYFPPIDRKFQENVTRERSYSKQGQMLTEDENIIEVPLTVQYKISNLQSFVLSVDQPEISLQHATDSAVRHVVGSTEMDQVLTEGRELIASEVRERLQRFLDNYGTGIVVTQVNIQSASAPREVQEAFDDVIRAREDEQREKNQAESYANGVIPEARGQAQRMLEEASGYRDAVISRATGEADRFSKLVAEYRKAPEVTRERLYLETMQEVMSNTSKVMVSGDGGQNLLYLPLDKMINSRGASTPAPAGVASGAAATQGTRLPPELDPREVRTRESR